jgi:hypothetical protein
MQHTTPRKSPRAKIDMLAFIDRSCPEQRAIGFHILKARQKRKLAEATKRGPAK